MSKSKYIGKIYEGRWKVVECLPKIENKRGRTYYVLENIYNHTKLTFNNCTFRRINRNETTIAKIMAIRISRDKTRKRKFVDDSVGFNPQLWKMTKNQNEIIKSLEKDK